MPTAPEKPLRIAVCVPTFRRREWLRRLLESLGEQTFANRPEPDLRIIVVDNDPDESARPLCDELRPQLRFPLDYETETRRGLSFVRNKLVSCVREWSDFLAFIDDDEAAEPDWLEQLLEVQERYDADVVTGPVIRHFDCEVPAWIVKGGFFEAARYPTGTPIRDPATNNALVRTAALPAGKEVFDERFALTGGEDTHFFLRLYYGGRTVVWADDAVVHEWIPATRANLRWLLQRIYSGANTWSMAERELRPGARMALTRMAKGGARIAYGLATLPFSVLGGKHRMARSLWYVWFGAGNLTGLLGIQRYTRQYLVHHGR